MEKKNSKELVDLKTRFLQKREKSDLLVLKNNVNKINQNKSDFKKKKEDEIDKLFTDNPNEISKNINNNLRIDQPSTNYNFFKTNLFFLFFLIIVISFIYFFWWKNNNENLNKQEIKKEVWYSLKLVDGSNYYGQVEKIETDPLILKNVYYDYDQLKENSASSTQVKVEEKKANNIRLVKRGKETHGPAGEMNIIRSQILFFEPLKEDSLVLKAILENERK